MTITHGSVQANPFEIEDDTTTDQMAMAADLLGGACRRVRKVKGRADAERLLTMARYAMETGQPVDHKRASMVVRILDNLRGHFITYRGATT